MTEDRFGITRPFVDEKGQGPLGFSRPLAKGQTMRLHGEIQKSIEDEDNAGAYYENIAGLAEELGYDGVAQVYREAAADEKRHNQDFQQALRQVERDIE